MPVIKRLLILLIVGVWFFVSATAIHAQGEDSVLYGKQNLDHDASTGNASLATYGPNIGEAVIYGFGKMIIEDTTMGNAANGTTQNYSAVPLIATAIDYTIQHKPLSSVEYVADVIHHFGVAQPAYAQGIGFSGLQPVLGVWKAFRNIAYLLYVIIFVIVGFMIMFRAKLNPQTVVNIQLALPNLIFTLVLITFSYAIAGLIVDFIYLSIYLLANLFDLGGLIKDGSLTANELLRRNIFGMAWTYFLGSGDASGMAAISMGNIVTSISNGVFGFLTSVLAYFIIAVAILIAVLRTFFALLKAYISIIVATVLAPIHILLNAIPGSDYFDNWWKGLIAAAATFPVTAFMILLGLVLMGSGANQGLDEAGIQIEPNVGFSGDAFKTGGFYPPFIVAGNVGTGVADSLQAFIGLGILLLLPEVLDLVRARLGVKDDFGKLVEKSLNGGWDQVYGFGKRGVGAWTQTQKEAEAQEAEWARTSKLSEGMGGAPIATPSTSSRIRTLRYLRNLLGL